MPRNIIGTTLLGQYRVESFLAAGGMGAVYTAWDLNRNVRVAMKVLHAELMDDPSTYDRFRKEAWNLEKLTHPNIVPFYGLHNTDDIVFLVERYVDGPSLSQLMKPPGKILPVMEALTYLKALCSALGYAHVNQVIHCDVKPGNVMIDTGGNIYLTDFGIARHAESTTTTLAGAGTPAYMAPEQIHEEAVRPETDVYALGLILFEMLTGQRPFPGTDSGSGVSKGSTKNERIRHDHVHTLPPDPCKINPRIPPALGAVILKTLEKDPARRPSSTQSFFEAVCKALSVLPEQVPDLVTPPRPPVPMPPIPPTPVPSPEPGSIVKPNPKGALYSLLGGLAVVVVVGILSQLGGGPPPSTATVQPLVEKPKETAAVASDANPGLTAKPTTALQTPTTAPPKPTNTLTPTMPPIGPRINWSVTNADPGEDEVAYVSLSFDSGGLGHVFIFNDNNRPSAEAIRYLTLNEDYINAPINISTGGSGYFDSSILSNSRDEILYFALYDRQKKQIDLMRKSNSGNWSTLGYWRLIEQNVHQIRPKLVVDPQNNNLYILFWNTETNEVSYLSGNGAKTNRVGYADSFGGAISGAIDSDGYFHVSFYDRGLAYYKFRVGGNGGQPEILDSGSENGFAPALGIDSQDNVHIVYYDNRNEELKYIVRLRSGWQNPESISNSVNLNPQSHNISMAVSPDNGIVHICYFNEITRNIEYLRGRSGVWDQPQTVGRSASTPNPIFCSIGLDLNGQPNIVYTMDHALYYARPK